MDSETPHETKFRITNRLGLATINEVSLQYGLTQRALRFYEQRGLLSPIRHNRGRFYDDAQKRRVQLIVKGKRLGFTLMEIAELVAKAAGEGDKAVASMLDAETIKTQLRHMEERRREIELAIEELRAALTKLL